MSQPRRIDLASRLERLRSWRRIEARTTSESATQHLGEARRWLGVWTWSSTTSSRGEAPRGAQAKGRPIRGGGRAPKTACSSPSRRVSESRKAESSRGERDETRNRNPKASARVRRPFGEEESLTVRSSRCHASCPSPSLGSRCGRAQEASRRLGSFGLRGLRLEPLEGQDEQTRHCR